jgi:hypothetical protein
VNKWRLWREYATGNHCKTATLHQFENGMYVSFKEHQSATEGQFAAWYIRRELFPGYFLDWCCIFGLIAINLFFVL